MLTWQYRSGHKPNIGMETTKNGARFVWSTGKRDVQVFVHYDYTDCHLGGQRIWFRCPCCSERCAVLYIHNKLACRKCHNMAYTSQSEGVNDRRIRQARKVANRVGVESMFWPLPPRPKHMRYWTYWRRMHDYERAQLLALASLKL